MQQSPIFTCVSFSRTLASFIECELSIRLKKQGRKHVDIAAFYENLGNTHLGLGDLEKAKSYYERALVFTHDMGEHEHVHVATTYNNLGDVHSELGHPKQARIYYNHALRIRVKQFGPDHIHVAATYGSLLMATYLDNWEI